jgi:Xaa-Pro dipeptidase
MTLGMMATYSEQRIDFDAMRKYKWDRLQAQLEAKNLGGLICFDPDNVRYATSTTLADWARDKYVRWCVIPRGGQPVLFEVGTAVDVKKNLCPWIETENIMPGGGWLRGANHPTGNELAVMMTAMKIKGALDKYKVSDMPIGIDTADLYILNGLKAQGLDIVNGWDAMWDARVIKSPDELKIIEMSAALADGCWEYIVDFIRPGVKESELVGEIYGWLLKHGADRITGVNCVSGPRSNPHPHDFSDRLIRPGDLVYIDIMSHYLGYGTCYYRTFATTKATQRQKDLYKKAYEWLQRSIDVVKPGITTDDIAMQWPTAQEMGYPDELAAAGLNIGHGIGLSIHEKPFITRALIGVPSVIEEGMHFALETYAGEGEDGARIESQLIVTKDGHKVITQWPCEELMVCAPR